MSNLLNKVAHLAAHLIGQVLFQAIRENRRKKSDGKWVMVEIELPHGNNAKDIDISSILLKGTVHAESWPYSSNVTIKTPPTMFPSTAGNNQAKY